MDRIAPRRPLAARSELVAGIDARLQGRGRGEHVGVLSCRYELLAGHAGEELQAAMGGRLASLVRARDSAGWLDTDHAVIVTSDLATERDLRSLADRLLAATVQPLRFRDGSVRLLSLSIGVATTLSDPRATGEELLEGAEAAMAEAVREGGDRAAVLDGDLRARTRARRELERDLRLALDDHQLEVHYQPVVDVATGSVDSLEALIRWPHPVRGQVHPSAFLPVAAGSGLLVEIGELVLERACRQAAEWSETAGRPITVSVNVGPEQLLGSDLAAAASQALSWAGLPAEQLEIEIAEAVLADRLTPVSLALRRLPPGIGVAIDGAAGGPATFRNIRSLPLVSTLKLDPALVEGLGDGTVDRAAFGPLAGQAASLGVAAVATGVEQVEQLEALRTTGIRLAQGFLLQRPVAGERLGALVVTGCAAAQAPAVELASFER